nr:neprilysin-2-like [Leptinotarsa decemlineata]
MVKQWCKMSWGRYFANRTKLEKGLIVGLTGLSIIVIVLFICFLTSSDTNVCKEPQCIRAAVHILDTVDPQADPCEDFYQFACGTFLKNAFINGQPNTLSILSEITKNQLKNIVMEKTNETNLPKTLVMQRKFYRACLNTTAIEEDNDKTILNLLDQVTGGWPVLKTFNWVERDFEWSNVMLRARNLGLYNQFFFNVEVHRNHTDNKLKIWIKPPDRKEVSSFHWNKPPLEWKEQTVEIMTDIAALLGAKSVSVRTELRSTMTFAERLQEIIEKYHNETSTGEDPKKNVTVKCLNHKFIKIEWLNFLRNMTNLDLSGNEEVVFDVDMYFKDLYYLLLKTPKKIQANYMAWAIISRNIHYLSKKVRDKYDEMSKYSDSGEVETNSRSTKCFKLSTDLFGFIAQSEYVRRYTPKEKKVYIKEMIAYIKREMKESIKVTPWIDETSRKNALKQLKNISEAIGWIDQAVDVEKVDELTGLDKLTFSNDNVIHMARMTRKAKLDSYYKQIRLNNSDLYMVPPPKLDVNAYFSRQINLLILPASILQGHIFDAYQPHYMNYGALGSVIGHELTHGFSINDDSLESEKLWTNKSIENFENVSRCLVEEYKNFLKEIGQPTENNTGLEENLADFTGVNTAYTAYLNWVRKHGPEKSLPGIKYTPKQIFWIMASTYMCYEPRLSKKDDIHNKDDAHGQPIFRVMGRLKNSPYFAKDFNCPEGSKMNPKDKCRVYW